ncbi:MAG TPA: GYD domain-containing protein [Dehalococcoidia bacterium]|nr:GYD domain-containing protein [Dehalococcoidia bacterium]
MPKYVVLVNFTDEWRKAIKQFPERFRQIDQMLTQSGVTEIATVFTLGQYDAVSIVEAPDDETLARLVLAQAQTGSIQTTTLKGFAPAEFLQVIQSLP